MFKILQKIALLTTSICFFTAHAANAAAIVEVPYSFDYYNESDLDWADSDDDNNTTETALGFTVTIGGQSYSHFDLDSNGYVELLTDGSDSATEYSYGELSELIDEDDESTYLLAAYDDLSSESYGYYGYKLNADNAVFYWLTETYDDNDDELLNLFEIILYGNGDVRWNFNFAEYESYGNDLFTGLYFGNTGTIHEAASNEIPQQTSYLYREVVGVPEPMPLSMAVLGLMGIAIMRRRKRT